MEWDWRNDPETADGGGGVLPAGKYVARAVKTAVGESTNKHTPFVEVHFEILADADRDPRGGKVKTTFYLSGKAKPKFGNLLRAIDAPRFDPSDAESTGMAILGRTLWVDVIESTYTTTIRKGPDAGQEKTLPCNEIEFGMFELSKADKAQWPNIPAASYLSGEAGSPPPRDPDDPGPSDDCPF